MRRRFYSKRKVKEYDIVFMSMKIVLTSAKSVDVRFHPGIHCLQNNSLGSYRSTKGEGDDFVAVDPLIVVTPLMYVFRGGGGSVCCWLVVRCSISCLTNISQMKRGLFIVSLVGCG